MSTPATHPHLRPVHPKVELRANLKSISHRCHLFDVAFVWVLTRETICLPPGCLQGGCKNTGHTVEYDPFIESQLASRNQLCLAWCQLGQVTRGFLHQASGFRCKTFRVQKQIEMPSFALVSVFLRTASAARSNLPGTGADAESQILNPQPCRASDPPSGRGTPPASRVHGLGSRVSAFEGLISGAGFI